jgi:hypothetical protein
MVQSTQGAEEPLQSRRHHAFITGATVAYQCIDTVTRHGRWHDHIDCPFTPALTQCPSCLLRST